MTTELRLALRRLRRSPGFAAAALLTLALGIGANTLVFSAVRGILLRPLPLAHAERLVWVYGRDGARADERGPVSDVEARALADLSSTFDAVAVFGDRSFVHHGGGRPESWTGLWATPALFAALEVTPVLGRAFTAEDGREGGPRVLMLGWERWQRDFGGDPAIVGRVLPLGEERFTVIGVLPRGLAFPLGRAPQAGNGTGFRVGVQDFWIPGQDDPAVLPGGTLLARLRPGVSMAEAGARVALTGRAVAASTPARAGRALRLVPLRDQVLGLMRPALQLLQGFAALVLLIACGNLASLMLARASARERELAVRGALGASPGRAVRGLVTESLLLTAAGGALGVLLAWWGRELLGALAGSRVPLLERVALDGPVLLVTLLACAVTTLLFGLGPAAAASVSAAQPRLQAGGRSHTAGPRQMRLRHGLVVAQVAMALVLLAGAALVLRSLQRLMGVDAGYRAEHVVVADIQLFGRGYAPFYQRLHERLRAMPGVEAVGTIQSTPLTGRWTMREPLVVAGDGPDTARAPAVPGSFVAFDYFAAMGIRVLDGRSFTEREFLGAGAPPAVIINATAARRFFPGGSAVGRRVTLFGTEHTVVGVVADTRDVRLDAPAEPQWYQPLFFEGSQLVVRVAGDPVRAVAPLRRALLDADPRLIVGRVEPLDDIVAASVFERRLAMRLLSLFAALALALAAIGLYGVLSFGTTQRQREFGVRAALGAQRRDVLGLVLRQGMLLAGAGIALGLLAAVPLAGLLRGLLFEVTPSDPRTLGAIAAVLVLVAAAASWVPAWRASRVDPLVVLREE